MKIKVELKKLVFIENVEGAKKYISDNKKNEQMVIALNSEVEWFLEKNKVYYKSSFNYFDESSLKSLNEEIYNYCSVICEYINLVIKDKISFYSKNDINPGFSIFYFLKLAINTYLYYTHCINAVLLSEKPKEIIYYGKINPKPTEFSDYLKIPIYKILNDCAKQSKINFKIVKVSFKKSNYKISKKIILSSIIKRVKTKLYNIFIIKAQKISSNKFNLITYRAGFSIKSFSIELIKRNLANIYEFKDSNFKKVDKELNAFINFLLNDKNFKSLFIHNKINYFEYVSNLISHIIINYFSLVPLFIHHLRPFSYHNQKTVLMTPNISYPDEYLFISIAKMYGIKVITWQHGSYGMFKTHTLPVYIDIKHSDYWFSFGPGLENRYRNELKINNTKFKAIGNDDLKSYSINSKNKSNIILFPLRYFRESIISDSNMMYPLHFSWHEYKSIFSTFSKLEKFNFICNIFPSSNFNNSNKFQDYINHLKILNVELFINLRYVDLLEKTNLVIIEWPYTALIQAIASGKQIICLNKNWELDIEVEKSLRKRCFFAKNNDELYALLLAFDKGKLENLSNDDFINNYGNFKQDGKSWERAFNYIKNEVLKN